MARLSLTDLPALAALLAVAVLGASTPAQAQFNRPAAATPAPRPLPPPRETKLVEKKMEDLPSQPSSKHGITAMAIDPEKWKHAETENFILHYRRVTEAQKVAREVEYDLWFVATTLGATKERYQRKSHVYVFEDEDEWKTFVGQTGVPPWSASFAFGDELFLNVRRVGRGSGGSSNFDSTTLAHEATHAVVARLFPGVRWPLWLGEGFAEYMGGASVAARKGQSIKRFQSRLSAAEMPLDRLEALKSYPENEIEVMQLYQTSEKLVRFLMNEFPKERFNDFLSYVLGGKPLQDSILTVYSDKVKDWDAFMRRYERFTK
ncbi:MAG: hypothetical protein ACO1QR_05585 [Chthoniobacteraceae bacterium]